jgi:hypothetical protein
LICKQEKKAFDLLIDANTNAQEDNTGFIFAGKNLPFDSYTLHCLIRKAKVFQLPEYK